MDAPRCSGVNSRHASDIMCYDDPIRCQEQIASSCPLVPQKSNDRAVVPHIKLTLTQIPRVAEYPAVKRAIGLAIALDFNGEDFCIRLAEWLQKLDDSLTEHRISRDRMVIVVSLNRPDGDMWLPQMGQPNRLSIKPLNVPSAEVVVKRIQPDEHWVSSKSSDEKLQYFFTKFQLKTVFFQRFKFT